MCMCVCAVKRLQLQGSVSQVRGHNAFFEIWASCRISSAACSNTFDNTTHSHIHTTNTHTPSSQPSPATAFLLNTLSAGERVGASLWQALASSKAGWAFGLWLGGNFLEKYDWPSWSSESGSAAAQNWGKTARVWLCPRDSRDGGRIEWRPDKIC